MSIVDPLGALSENKRRLLALYRRGTQGGVRQAGPEIEPRSLGATLPLSYEQELIWLHSQVAPHLPLYNEILTVRRSGSLDLPALERSLGEIVRRHEAWRTTFAPVDGGAVQVVHPPPQFSLPVVDLTGLRVAEREPAALRLATDEVRRPLDLARGPLLRATLVRMAETEHRLYIVLHQIIFDGVSIYSVFLPELAALYEAFSSGGASPLPEPRIQYADYSVWRRRQVLENALGASLDYWRERLAGAPARLDLPLDRARPAVSSFRGRQEIFTLPPSLAESLKRVAQKEGVTLYVTLLAAFNVLLHRYTGQEDILVGTAISSRKRSDVEGLLGVFVNTVVVRTLFDERLTFRELLVRVKEATLEALSHGDVPFHVLVKELQPRRDPGHSPFFQVNFVLEPPRPAPLPGWEVAPKDVDAGMVRVDLDLQLDDRADGLVGHIRYSEDLFEPSTIARLVEHLAVLLEGIATDTEQPVSAIPILTESERTGVREAHDGVRPSNAFVAFEADEIEQSIPRRFGKQVARHPDRVAVRTGHIEWRYSELDQAANRVSHGLSSSGIESGATVALLLDQDAPMLAGMLGVLKHGCAYVPLDPTHPGERLRQIVADAGASALLTNRANFSLARELVMSEVSILEIEGILRGPAVLDPAREVPPDQLAYILYTSGSTGRPKGVAQSHRNVLHFIAAYTNNLHISPDDRLTLLPSYSVDAAVMDIFAALLNGATLCPVDVKGSGLGGICDRLARDRITIYHSTPTLYRHVAHHLSGRSAAATVRLVVLGGEEVRSDDVELCREHFPPDCIFVNGFGPTESTVSLQSFVDPRGPCRRRSIPIGYPVERTAVSLLSRDGHPGQVYGEIAIRSPYVALGYWRDPALTGAAFQSNAALGKDRIYKTGDMGRLLPDGSIEFLGRRDLQVKVQGFRVELGEVEVALSRYPGVKETAASLVETGDGGKRLVAYFVAERDGAPTADEIRRFLRGRLPAHMIPSSFVRLDVLPLTPSGKLDRRALPVPEQRPAADKFTAPRDHVEQKLAEIWRGVLAVESVGMRDNFFDLGGHSVLALRMMADIESRFGIALPLATLLEAPTIERLAELLRSELDAQPTTALVTIQPTGGRPRLFRAVAERLEILIGRAKRPL